MKEKQKKKIQLWFLTFTIFNQITATCSTDFQCSSYLWPLQKKKVFKLENYIIYHTSWSPPKCKIYFNTENYMHIFARVLWLFFSFLALGLTVYMTELWFQRGVILEVTFDSDFFGAFVPLESWSSQEVYIFIWIFQNLHLLQM